MLNITSFLVSCMQLFSMINPQIIVIVQFEQNSSSFTACWKIIQINLNYTLEPWKSEVSAPSTCRIHLLNTTTNISQEPTPINYIFILVLNIQTFGTANTFSATKHLSNSFYHVYNAFGFYCWVPVKCILLHAYRKIKMCGEKDKEIGNNTYKAKNSKHVRMGIKET